MWHWAGSDEREEENVKEGEGALWDGGGGVCGGEEARAEHNASEIARLARLPDAEQAHLWPSQAPADQIHHRPNARR
jgi:hypothetical protein